MRLFLALISLSLLSACNEEKLIRYQLDYPPACLSSEQISDPRETGRLFFSSELIENSEQALELSPDQLSLLVLGGNRSLLVGSVQVLNAKKSLNLSRSELLPSIQLGAALRSSLSPNFLMTSVEYLLPFLLPSNWAKYHQSKSLLYAEKAGFLTAQLNQLASAYALYIGLSKGLEMRTYLQEEYRDASVIEALTAEQVEIGELDSSQLDLARSQLTSNRARLWRLQRQIGDELAHLRQALGLCEDVQIHINFDAIKSLPNQNLSFDSALKDILSVSTELLQLEALELAATQGRWSQRFSFIGPVSAGESISGLVPDQELSFSFSKLIGRASVNFGFAQFARIDLASGNLMEIQARKLEVQMEIRRILEANLSALQNISRQLKALDQSVQLLKRVFTADQKRFRQQEISLQDLLETQARLRLARLERLQAEADLNLASLALHRLYRTDIFEAARGCAFGIRPEFANEDPLDVDCNEDYVKLKLGLNAK